MAGDKWKRGERSEDFNLASQLRDKPVTKDTPVRSPDHDNPTKDKWQRGQQSTGFNRAARARKRSTNDRKRPITQSELKRREADRARPRSVLTHTPGGRTEQFVNERSDNNNEKRIKHLRNRLARARNRARDDFERGR